MEDSIVPNYRLAPEAKSISAEVLRQLLASEYVLYVKTQNAHWNLIGPLFAQLHKLFGDQYAELAAFIDRIAEQIRKYGMAAPGSMQEFVSLNLGRPETTGALTPGLDLVKEALVSNEALIQQINMISSQVTFDLATQNLLGDLLDAHMKNAWMLRAHLE